MKTKITLLLMLFVAITLKAQVEPTDTDGDGSRNISTLAHLQWVSENSSCWGDNLELDNDIDAWDTYSWNSYKGFSPIGNSSSKFTGVFDGNNHVISGIYIDQPSSYMGFFGYTEAGCEIKNLGLEDCEVYGSSYTGGMVGQLRYSMITNCYVTGYVYGTSNYVAGLVAYDYYSIITSCYSEADVDGTGYLGGLVGYHNYSTIVDSYSTGSVYGTSSYVGGLIGRNVYSSVANSYNTGDVENTSSYTGGLTGYDYYSSVSNCYSTGDVVGVDYVGGLTSYCSYASIVNSYSTGRVKATSNAGGLVGYNSSGTYTGSFWDTSTSGYSYSAGGTGKSTADMKTKSTYTNAGWDFDIVWDINTGYPFIDIDMTNAPSDTDGDGSLNISTLTHLKWLSTTGFYADQDWELDNDIDASGTKSWEDGAGWSPIFLYTGNFDGNNYKISSLFIGRSSLNFIGLFGIMGATVQNLTLEKCDISGRQYVGAITGRSDGYAYKGKVLNCSISGSISGASSYVGGAVGYNYYGTIADCNVSADISNTSSYTGGLSGYNSYGNISNCSATGDVASTSSYSGGLIGYNSYGNISNCYTTGDVSGRSSYVGGLVGYHYYSTAKNSYATGSVSNTSSYTGGLVGRNYYSDITNCYATGSVNGSSYVGGFAGECYGSTSTAATITNSYSTGKVSGSSSDGGFVGSNTLGTYNNCFWDTSTSGYTTSAGGTGKSTADMKTKSTFTGWNFDNIWAIAGSYPYIYINLDNGPKDTDNDGSINISKLAHLSWLSETGYYAEKDWELDNDIDATDTKNWNSGAGFTPLSSALC